MSCLTRGPSLLIALLLALGGCESAPAEPAAGAAQAQPVTASTSAPSDLPNFVLGSSASGFLLGPAASNSEEFGLDKVTGAYGVLATNPLNGAVAGIPIPGSPALSKQPYGNSAAEHNAFVKDYFVSHGLPEDQVLEVLARTGGTAGAPVTDPSAVQRLGPVVRYSSLVRGVDGIPVVDSYAWARIDADGEVVELGVYWPTIPGSVVANAEKLAATIANSSGRAAFVAGLPAAVQGGQGRVVIRHSCSADRGPFVAFASYDVVQEVGGAARIRHFDASGHELFLPSEKAAAAPSPAVKTR